MGHFSVDRLAGFDANTGDSNLKRPLKLNKGSRVVNPENSSQNTDPNSLPYDPHHAIEAREKSQSDAERNSSTNRNFPPLPFAHLNLRFNPFGELPLEYRADLAIVDIMPFVQKLKNPNYAVQFIGRKGRGKTTHLLSIQSHFANSAYVHIKEDERPVIPHGDPLIIDEAQRLTPKEQHLSFSQNVALAIGTHRDLTFELERYRYQVETIEVSQLTSPQRIHDCTNRRIEFARRAFGPIPSITFQTAQALFDELGADIRAIEARLYEIIQNMETIQNV